MTTTYYLSGSQIIAELTDNGITVYLYDANGSPVGMKYRGLYYTDGVWDVYWYEKNLHGDIISIYSTSGAELISYTYDAWGNCTTDPAVTDNYILNNNPFRYRGYYYDTDLGLYYLNSRYYDAKTGRFISPDDVGYLGANGDINSYNLYAYCSNNPIMYADPSGCSISGAIIVASAILGSLLGSLSAATTQGNIIEGAIEGALTGTLGSICGLFFGNPFLAVGVSTIGAAFIDGGTQLVSQYLVNGSASFKEIDFGRVLKVGVQTGLSTAVPVLGNAKGNVVDAVGTALIWGESSAIITISDIIISNIFSQNRRTESSNSNSYI